MVENATRVTRVREPSSTCKLAVEVMQDGASDGRSNHFLSSCMVAVPSSPFQWVSNSVKFPWGFASETALSPCVKMLLMQGILLQQQGPKQLQELQM